MNKRLALVVGIDEYPSDPLSCCVNDAKEMAAALQMEEYGFTTKLMVDESATRKAILRELDTCRVQQPSLFVFYFSGHGCSTITGAYLVTHDGEPLDEGLDLTVLSKILSNFSSQGTTTVVILDCCHSGAASPWSPEVRPLTRSEVERAMPSVGEGKVVLAACRPEQYSYEDSSIGHGLFTNAILGGLMGEAADHEGDVSVHGLYEYACKPFEAETKQTPVFRGDVSGRVVLAQGFPPRIGKPVEEDLLRSLENEAERFLEDYVSLANMPLNEWREVGYKSACQRLEPVLRWFEARTREYPDLGRRRKFKQLTDTAYARLAHLGNVDPGTKVAQGTLSHTLGEGAFGAVWKVIPERPDDVVLAYKIYHPRDLHIKDKVARFSRGYRAMRQLDHPNIVRVHSYTNCPIGFFMDFIEGPNLRNLSAGLDDSVAKIGLLYGVAETLLHAHDREVIHRDIKPENIIASYDETTTTWRPHLTDFDLAWFSTATQLTRDAMGTAFYAAPEQLANPRSKAAHQNTVDVYAFGQLCYFVVTGSDPIPMGLADNTKTLRRRIEEWPSERAAREFLELYTSATAFRPEDRPSGFGFVKEALSLIMHSLRDISPTALLTQERFVSELMFSVSGLQTDEGTTFTSTSGRTVVDLGILEADDIAGVKSVLLEIRLSPAGGMMFEGITTERGRIVLNRSVDTAIRSFDKVKRRSGTQGTYEVFVDCRNIPLNRDGLEYCIPVLLKVIEAVERT